MTNPFIRIRVNVSSRQRTLFGAVTKSEVHLNDTTISSLENHIVGSTGMAERNEFQTLQRMAGRQLASQLF